jgi:hypothetical protein
LQYINKYRFPISIIIFYVENNVVCVPNGRIEKNDLQSYLLLLNFFNLYRCLHENVLSLYVCLLLCPESQRNVHKKTVMLILLRIRVFIYYKLIFMSQMLLLKIKEWLVMGFIPSALYGWSIQIYQPTPFRGCHHVFISLTLPAMF